jgi:hypothetical protein
MTGDTIRSMRLCTLAVLAACNGDPTLAVNVTHPTGLSVTKTAVTVYESATLHCVDVEYSRLDPAALEALVTSEVDIDAAASGSLAGISRTANKVIVARGYDINEALVSAGCVEKGEVTGNESVDVTTLIAAIVSVHPPTDTSLDTVVTVTDANGGALPDQRPVTWTVYGAAGTMAANPANVDAVSDGVWEPKLPSCVGADGAKTGVMTIHPNPPSSISGYAVQIRAAWAVEQPPPFTSLAASAFGVTDLGITTYSSTARRACQIRVSGTTHHLVCVDDAEMAHDYAISVANGKATATQQGAAVLAAPAGQKAIALVAVVSGTTRDVYGVSDKGTLTALFGAATPTDPGPTCLLAPCTDAMVIPACGNAASKMLLATVGSFHQTDARGGNNQLIGVPGGTEVRLDNAGCVTSLQSSGEPLLAQLATVHGGTTAIELFNSGTYFVSCTTGTCTVLANVSLTKGAGVGFTAGSEPRVVVTTVDATGVVLVSDVFSPSGGSIERARMPAVSIPNHIVAGQVDTDTGPDLFWDVSARADTTNFEIAYARMVGNDNLEALSGQTGFTVGDLLSGDLNGDGLDDLVIVTSVGITIVPMGVAIPAPAANSDPTCMPE